MPVDLQRLEDLLLSAGPRLTPEEVTRAAGVDRTLADRLWQAMGFPVSPDEARAYTTADAEALARAGAIIAAGLADPERLVHVTRTLGQSVARIADTLTGTSVLSDVVDGRLDRDAAADLAPVIVPELEALLVYLFRRHLLAAAARLAEHDEGGGGGGGSGVAHETCVGFADLVGFTRLSQQLPDDEIADVVVGFEAAAAEIVVRHGGRIVKTIGDEVLFTVGDPAAAADIALDLSDAATAAEDLPDVRVGLALGPVLVRYGDVLGPVVNLAARVVKAARAGTVLVDDAMAARLADDDRYGLKPVRPRSLKGIGTVPLHVLRRQRIDR